MARRFGPSRAELKFRAAVSVFGLGLLAYALAARGLPQGPALIEVAGLAGLMFGGSFVISVRRLIRKDHP